jgi:hypothetical protein
MRNLFISMALICIVLLVFIYMFIPSRITFSKVIIINTKINVAGRFLTDENNWRKWFPSEANNHLPVSSPQKSYAYKGQFYSIEKKMMNAAEISISNDQSSLNSLITMISINADSIAIEWESNMPTAINPWSRVKNYLKARKLQNNMADILGSLKIFLGREQSVYGMDLQVIISKDSTLVATKCFTNSYPSTSEIYKLIGNLKRYIIQQGAKEINYPMLNVRKLTDTTFEAMVAISVNKSLSGNSEIFYKRFVPWKVLTAEIKGGNYTVNEAMNQMAIYLSDHQISAMAIPFASLVTDRTKQPDTLKWVTRINTPVP